MTNGHVLLGTLLRSLSDIKLLVKIFAHSIKFLFKIRFTRKHNFFHNVRTAPEAKDGTIGRRNQAKNASRSPINQIKIDEFAVGGDISDLP